MPGISNVTRIIRVGVLAGVLTFALMLSPEPSDTTPSVSLAQTPSATAAGFALSQEQRNFPTREGTKASGG